MFLSKTIESGLGKVLFSNLILLSLMHTSFDYAHASIASDLHQDFPVLRPATDAQQFVYLDTHTGEACRLSSRVAQMLNQEISSQETSGSETSGQEASSHHGLDQYRDLFLNRQQLSPCSVQLEQKLTADFKARYRIAAAPVVGALTLYYFGCALLNGVSLSESRQTWTSGEMEPSYADWISITVCLPVSFAHSQIIRFGQSFYSSPRAPKP